MLRALFSGVSGLRSHQTMIDVVGNNIANVNTPGFKGSQAQFQDTLSQILRGGGAGTPEIGGTNPAQVGLGVQVAGISTNFAQGSAKATGRPTDLMISGDGVFTVRSGEQTLYTRAGAFEFDPLGRLVSPSGDLVQGWIGTNGVINPGGPMQDITLPLKAISPARATTAATFGGNLPDDAAVGDTLIRDLDVFDAAGNKTTLSITFTRNATGWDVSEGGTSAGTLTYASGALTSAGNLTIGGLPIDFTTTTGFAKLTTVGVTGQDGRAVGSLDSYAISPDGTIVGTFSNGANEPLARIAMATFINPGGLMKAGGSTYEATANSGAVQYGTAGSAGYGKLASGYLEMSNVDLSQEFADLIVAQRGFQANARIITTGDQILEEVTNLKR
ncbi:flagellar hook protein FlgE [Agromyces humi]|uniref:flagellar hook protein FlgE n=1 Tax=Agromyces humi TaxID=1766800 RepID=UPI00135C03BD|nr:flagellar hook protein FlgE [Agromyces humi]